MSAFIHIHASHGTINYTFNFALKARGVLLSPLSEKVGLCQLQVMHAYFHVLCQDHPELLVLTGFTLFMLENGNQDISV